MSHDNDPITICEYSPSWPDRFEELAARAKNALGNVVLRIEHIGSTAVPGLAAKPVIDLDVVISRNDMPEAIRRLADLGYIHEGDLGISKRQSFRTPAGEPRHHLYVVHETAPELQRHLAFRDALRANPMLRERYAALKRTFAAEYAHSRKAYEEAKPAFVREVLSSQLGRKNA